MDDFASTLAVLRASADPTRLHILLALQRRPLCVCELVTLVDVGQPAVSRHLGILQRAGLIDSRRDGWWVEYHLVDPSPSVLIRQLLESLRESTSLDPHIAAFAARVDEVDRSRLRGTSVAPTRATRRTKEART